MTIVFRLSIVVAIAVTGAGESFGQPTNGKAPRVYVPLEDLETIVGTRRGVFLPKAKYEELEKKARANRAPNVSSGLLVTSVAYVAKPDGRQLRLTANVNFRQFGTGWQSLSLPISRMAVERALLDGKTAQLGYGRPIVAVAKGKSQQPVLANPELKLFHDGPGRHELALDLATPLTSDGSDRVAAFGLIPSPAAVVQLTVPAGKSLHIDGLRLERPAADDKPATYRIPVGGKRELAVRITDKDGGQKAADSLLFAQTTHRLDVAASGVRWQARTSLNAFGESPDRLVFLVPKSLEIADVSSTGLESWQLDDAADDNTRTQITLNYRQPLRGGRSISFRGVISARTGAGWKAPTLTLNKVTSHTGRVFALVPPDLRLVTKSTKGARRTTIRKLPAGVFEQKKKSQTVRVGELGAWQIWDQNFDLSFTTKAKGREVLLDDVVYRMGIGDHELTLGMAATIECLYEPLFEMAAEIPADWAVNSVLVRGKRVEWQRDQSEEAGQRRIRIPISPPLRPGETLTLAIGSRRALPTELRSDSGKNVTLPISFWKFADGTILGGGYTIVAGEDYSVTVENVAGMESAALEAAQNERAGFRFVAKEAGGVQDIAADVKLARRAGRIAAETRTFLRLKPQTWTAHLEAHVEVVRGSVRDVVVSLPTAVVGESADDIRFQLTGSSARLTAQAAEKGPAGQSAWRLKFDQPMRGGFVLHTQIERPRNDKEKLTIPAPNFPGADRVSGALAVESSAEERVAVTTRGSDGKPLRELEPADLPACQASYVPGERIVAAFEYADPRYTAIVNTGRLARIAIPTAIAEELTLRSLLGNTGEFQHVAEMKFRTVSAQGLQFTLPESARLWAAVLNDDPVEVRRADSAYFISLPPGVGDFHLKLFYRTNSDHLEAAGELKTTPPEFSIRDSQGASRALPILLRKWNLHHSKDTLVLSSDGDFEPHSTLDRPGLLANVAQSLGKVDRNQLPNKGILLAIAVGLIALLALGCAHSGWRGLGVGCLLLLIFGGVYSVSLTATSSKDARYAAERSPMVLADSGTDGKYKAEGPAAQPPAENAPNDKLPPAKPLEPEAPTPKKDPGRVPGTDPFTSPPGSPAGPAIGGGKGGGGNSKGGGSKGDGRGPKGEGGEGKGKGKKDIVANDPRETPDANDARNAPPAPPRRVDPNALLSLNLEFQAPENTIEKEFRFDGVAEDNQGTLTIRYEQRSSGGWLMLAIAAGVLLFCWVFRSAPAAFRAVIGSMALVLPLAGATLLPLEWHAIVDGVFIGAVMGILLWVVIGVVKAISPKPAVLKTAAMVLAFGFLANNASARKPVPPPPSSAAAKFDSWFPDGRVIVPYEQGTNPLKSKRVFISEDAYRRLNRLADPKAGADSAPISGMVTSATYTADLTDAGYVAVKGQIVLHSFREGRVSLSLPIGNVALQSAKLDGKPAALISNKQGYRIVLNKSGAYVLDLEFRVPVSGLGGGNGDRKQNSGRFTLPLKAVPAATLRFGLPNKTAIAEVANASAPFRQIEDANSAVIAVPVGRGGNVSVSWRPPGAAGDNGTIVQTTGSQILLFDDTGMTLKGTFDANVRRGTTSSLQFHLPEKLKVRRIAGPDVGGWKQTDPQPPGKSRVLTVLLRRPVSGKTRVEFELFGPQKVATEATSATLPVLLPTKVSLSAVTYGVATGFRFRMTRDAGQRKIEPGRFPRPANSGSAAVLAAYRITQETPPAMTAEISRRQPAPKVVAEHKILVGARTIRQTARIRIVPQSRQSSPVARATLNLPLNFVPVRVQATGLSDWFLDEDPDGFTTLGLDFATPQTGTVEIVIDGRQPMFADEASMELEVPTLLGNEDGDEMEGRYTATLAVWFGENYRASLGEDGAEGWTSIDPQTLPEGAGVLAGKTAGFAFRANTPPEILAFDLRKAKASVSGQSAVGITVTDTFRQYWLGLRWRVRQAAVEELHFVGPSWLANQLQFPRNLVRQVTEHDHPGNRRRWSIQLNAPASSDITLVATATLAPGKAIAAPLIEFVAAKTDDDGEVTFTPLETRQYLLVSNQSRSRLDFVTDAKAAATREVQMADVPFRFPGSLSERYTEIRQITGTGNEPAWNMTRIAALKQSAASVLSARHTTVLSKDGSFRSQIDYRMRNRSRQYLAVVLPEKTAVLSVFVSDKPERPVTIKRNKVDYVLMALPKTGAAGQTFTVTLVVSGKIPVERLVPRGGVAAEEFSIPSPRVVGSDLDEEFGIPVLRTEWTLYLPKDIEAWMVEGGGKSNVLPRDERQRQADRLQEDFSAADELISVLKDPNASAKAKSLAWSNLSEIENKTRSLPIDNYGDEETLGKLRSSRTRLENEFNAFKRHADTGKRDSNFLQQLSANEQRGELQKEIEQFSRANNDIKSSGEKNAPGAFGYKLNSPQQPTKPQPVQPGYVPDNNFGNKQSQLRTRDQRGPRQIDRLKGQFKSLTESIPNAQEQPPPPPQPADPKPKPNANPQVKLPNAEKTKIFTAATGGLSLKIELPAEGRKLTFTKAGGNPSLTLAVLPEKTVERGTGIIWAALWGILLLVALVAVSRHGAIALLRVLPWASMLAGLTIYLLVPGAAAIGGLALFVIGFGFAAFGFAIRKRQRAATANA